MAAAGLAKRNFASDLARTIDRERACRIIFSPWPIAAAINLSLIWSVLVHSCYCIVYTV
jgi:hypothetical protein